MAFRFPLATLLRLREIVELREERLLAQILNHMAQSNQALASLEERRRSLIAQRELALQQLTPGFDITASYRQLHEIGDLERTGKEQLDKLAALRKQQMKVYETAHRNKQLLSSMRSDQLDAFQQEQNRQEQNAMDDNFSSRRRLG